MRVERLQREFELDVVWRPFELHPEIPLEGKVRGESGRSRRLPNEHLRTLAEEAGLTWDPPTLVPNSHRSLEAAEFAREHGAFDAYHRALFSAYFSEGRDIGDPAVLAEVATACGLDPAAMGEAIESKRYAGLVDEQTEDARHSGISGTPTVIFEAGERRLPIVGAQEYAVFQNVATRMGATPKVASREPEPAE